MHTELCHHINTANGSEGINNSKNLTQWISYIYPIHTKWSLMPYYVSNLVSDISVLVVWSQQINHESDDKILKRQRRLIQSERKQIKC